MTWATYRDPRGPSTVSAAGSAAYYRAHQDTAAVSYDIFRARRKRGWDAHDALTTPQVKEWGTTRARVLAIILAQPGILRRALAAEFRSASGLSQALFSLQEHGLIRCDVRGPKHQHAFTVCAPDEIAASRMVLSTQDPGVPFVNPIRARALGLPVATTERTREVWEA